LVLLTVDSTPGREIACQSQAVSSLLRRVPDLLRQPPTGELQPASVFGG
jgi:hypothetical protein